MSEHAKARAIGFNHVALEVGDIDEALAFYGRLLRFELRSRSAEDAFIDLGDQFIALQKGRSQPPDDGRHFGLVVDDKEAVRRALAAAGVTVLPGPFMDFLDPWGNRIEIVGYENIQFTKAPNVLRGMRLTHLRKKEAALKELAEKGMSPEVAIPAGFEGEHATRSHFFEVCLPVAKAFELFEPEGERAWAAGWEPRHVHPKNGAPGEGMVFLTGRGEEETIWTMLRHDPRGGVVEYLRTTPASRVARVLVECEALDAGRTRVKVTYEFTGLSAAGNAWVRQMDDPRFREFIDSWGTAIAKALGADQAAAT